ncbi:AF4/FMR2 family member lilli-like isoform X2 [Condylostylus longicornis]|uniref:AF4/FMR2 family member lilli-like isoform X2 n=1 Tax=Condylostylus longicornis TaxID=2530218 RepID=UPI00244DD383|nr:AF4/FMR2 family member lilli-like isoform X2 [Condylostylus longicornis]
MSSWAQRVHRRAADLGSVVTSCGHPGPGPYPYRLEKVKFGVPLDEVCKNDIPGPLLVLILKLNKEAPLRKDVFRAPGHQGAMKNLIHFLQAGRLVNVDNYSVYTIASVLKKFLRKIPNGIFGRDGEAELFAIVDVDDELEQQERIHRLITSLPIYTQRLLVLLFGTFRVIASNADRAGTGMSSEALGVSVAPSFFQSCVSDGKTARMEDVLRFKVATRIMKKMIDHFATYDLFGRENYEYYARVTGRILKVQDEWICSFRFPPPPRGKLAQQNYALQLSLEAEKTWLQCECERWGLIAQEESQSTPALLTSSSSAIGNSALSLGIIPELSLLESCARLSVSLEGPGVFSAGSGDNLSQTSQNQQQQQKQQQQQPQQHQQQIAATAVALAAAAAAVQQSKQSSTEQLKHSSSSNGNNNNNNNNSSSKVTTPTTAGTLTVATIGGNVSGIGIVSADVSGNRGGSGGGGGSNNSNNGSNGIKHSSSCSSTRSSKSASAAGSHHHMTMDELRAVNRYAESTKSLSYLPQVHERQRARMRTRSEWFLESSRLGSTLSDAYPQFFGGSTNDVQEHNEHLTNNAMLLMLHHHAQQQHQQQQQQQQHQLQYQNQQYLQVHHPQRMDISSGDEQDSISTGGGSSSAGGGLHGRHDLIGSSGNNITTSGTTSGYYTAGGNLMMPMDTNFPPISVGNIGLSASAESVHIKRPSRRYTRHHPHRSSSRRNKENGGKSTITSSGSGGSCCCNSSTCNHSIAINDNMDGPSSASDAAGTAGVSGGGVQQQRSNSFRQKKANKARAVSFDATTAAAAAAALLPHPKVSLTPASRTCSSSGSTSLGGNHHGGRGSIDEETIILMDTTESTPSLQVTQQQPQHQSVILVDPSSNNELKILLNVSNSQTPPSSISPNNNTPIIVGTNISDNTNITTSTVCNRQQSQQQILPTNNEKLFLGNSNIVSIAATTSTSSLSNIAVGVAGASSSCITDTTNIQGFNISCISLNKNSDENLTTATTNTTQQTTNLHFRPPRV